MAVCIGYVVLVSAFESFLTFWSVKNDAIYETQNLVNGQCHWHCQWQGVMKIRECNGYYLLYTNSILADKNTVTK